MIFSSMNLTYGFSTEQTVHYIPELSHLCRCIRVLLEYLTHFGYILFMFSISVCQSFSKSEEKVIQNLTE